VGIYKPVSFTKMQLKNNIEQYSPNQVTVSNSISKSIYIFNICLLVFLHLVHLVIFGCLALVKCILRVTWLTLVFLSPKLHAGPWLTRSSPAQSWFTVDAKQWVTLNYSATRSKAEQSRTMQKDSALHEIYTIHFLIF